MKITCAIADDEPFARRGIEGYVRRVSFLQLEGVFEDAVSLSNFLQERPLDLLFLDIEMPVLSGVELLQSLLSPPKVIFITAYTGYAVKGFELDVVDYLLKPVSFARFLKAANKVRTLLETQGKATAEYMYVKCNGKIEKVGFKSLLYAEAKENYVLLHTLQNRLMVRATLKSLLEHLPSEQFIAVHKSYIVNIQKISTVEGNLLVIDNARLPISRSLREQVLEKILKGRCWGG